MKFKGEDPPFMPQIKMKKGYDAPSSGYGKVVPSPKEIIESDNGDFKLDAVKYDNENKFPKRALQHTLLTGAPVAMPDEDGMF